MNYCMLGISLNTLIVRTVINVQEHICHIPRNSLKNALLYTNKEYTAVNLTYFWPALCLLFQISQMLTLFFCLNYWKYYSNLV